MLGAVRLPGGPELLRRRGWASAVGSLGGGRWWGLSGAFAVKPEARDGGGRGPPGAASPLVSRLLTVFLPQGFPESVSPDYLSYQLWDSVQVSGQRGPPAPGLQTGPRPKAAP